MKPRIFRVAFTCWRKKKFAPRTGFNAAYIEVMASSRDEAIFHAGSHGTIAEENFHLFHKFKFRVTKR